MTPARHSSSRRITRSPVKLLGFVVLSLCAGGALVAFMFRSSPEVVERRASIEDVADASSIDVPDIMAGLEGSRLVYPYSVVAGGVHTAAELSAAVEADPVVAAHYAHLSGPALRQERVRERRAVYMSYRVGDKVYWTRRPVALKPGELVLSDGRSEVRARCGNCISDVPMEPTLAAEPDPAEFDRGIAGPLAALGDLGLPGDPRGDGFPFGAAFPAEMLTAPLAALPAGLGGPSASLAFPGGSAGAPRLALPGGLGDDPIDPGPFGPSPLLAAPGDNDPDPVPSWDDEDQGDPLSPPPGPWRPTEPAPVPVPEPGSILLVGTGVAAYAMRRLRGRARGRER